MDQPSVQEEKRRLRATLRSQLRALDEELLCRSDAALFEAFLALPALVGAKTVLLYYGVGREPQSGRLFSQLLAQGKRLAFPRCLEGQQMEARLVREEAALLPGAFGIPEPTEQCLLIEKAEIDLILVPALCCDRACNRLGQGGGYYDRYLADYAGVTVALCRDALLQERLPRQDFDRPLALVLTETEILVPKGTG